MVGSLGKLNVSLTAETAQFIKAMDKAAFTADMKLRNLERTAKVAGAAIGGFLLAGATGFAVKMKQIIDDSDQLNKVSLKLGMTTESLSALRYAADLSGVSFEQLTKGFAKLSKTASDASNGMSTAKRAFETIGISTVGADGTLRNIDDLLPEIADKFKNMADGAQKAALAQELFGKSGIELIPFLNAGREGLAATAAEAERLGIIMDSKTAKAAEEFNDNITRLQKSFDGIFYSLSNSLIPVLLDYSGQLVENIDGTNQLTTAGDKLVSTVLTLGGAVSLLNEFMKTWAYSLADTAAAAAALTQGNFSGAMMALEKSGRDVDERWKETIASIEQMWARHWERQKQIAAEGAAAINQQTESINTDLIRMMEEGEKLTEQMRTPIEKLQAEQEHLNELIQAGAISYETYGRAAEKVIADYDKATQTTKNLNKITEDLNMTFTSSFENAIMEGKKFHDVLEGLANDIARIALRRAVLEPIFGGIFGAGGIFSAKGNVFSNGRVVPFANGGIINSPISFPLAGGKRGIAGEAGIEGILPLVRTSGGDLGVKSQGGGGTVVNVYAPPGSSVKEERNFEGSTETISIFIDEAVGNNINRPGSKTHRALKESFGLGQKLINR